MNAKTILAASLAVLAIGAGAPSVAAVAGQSGSGDSGMMQRGGSSGQSPSMMGSAASSGATSGGMMGMMGGGAMGGGMMNMMEGCPMAMGSGLDRKTAMKMHGEMMRAMGDILIKYADKVQEPATKQ